MSQQHYLTAFDDVSGGGHGFMGLSRAPRRAEGDALSQAGRDMEQVSGASPFATKAGGAEFHRPPNPLSEISDEGTLSVTVGGSVSAVIDTLGDHDTINVTLVAGQTYLISLQGSGASPLLDSLLTVANPANAVVAQDDDGGTGTWSLITLTAATSGTYHIDAAAFDDSDTGGYTIDVRQKGADNVPGTIASTVAVNLTGPTFGFIETSNDVDVYTVTLDPGLIYFFDLAGGADYTTNPAAIPAGELDTRVTLLDAAGNIVATNDDIDATNDLSSQIVFAPSEGGSYYIKVEAHSGQTGGYVLNTFAADPGDFDPLDSIDWGTQLPSTAVTVYFAAAGQAFAGVTSLGWTDYEKARAMAALETWGNVTNLTFAVTNNPSTATFKLVTTHSNDFLGYFNPPGETDQGVGVFATDGTGWADPGGLEQGGYGFITLVHEFGHGLGLAHPHDTGGQSSIMLGVTGQFGSYGVYDLNQGVYTTMSYNDGWQFNPAAVDGYPPGFPLTYGYQGGPSALDIAVVQQKYGADAGRGAGDTVYVLPTANTAGTFWTAIWDSGGTDTIVQNGSNAALIDLTAATLDYSPTGGGVVSYVAGIFGGYTIANGTVIENATGGSGNDVIVGNAAANILTGNAGNDVFKGGDGADQILGGAGNDTIHGEADGDTLKGDAGNDVIDGGAGDDLIDGGVGNDAMSGGDGIDTLTYAGVATRVTVNLSLLTAQATTGAGTDTLSGFENLVGTAFNDTLTGDGGDNVLTAGLGNDTLVGGAGNDTLQGNDGNDSLEGGVGDDSLDGGAGTDAASYAGAASAVTVSLLMAGAQNTGGAGSDTLVGIEGLTGSAFADTLTGDAGANSLLGGSGNDLLTDGLGNDLIDGGLGVDTVNYADATPGITLNLLGQSAQITVSVPAPIR